MKQSRETKSENLLFGAAYYPEYMPRERLNEDIGMMKKAGMNVLRIAESTWSTLEPKQGEYNFSYIDRVLSAAKEAEMYVIISMPTCAVPAWLAKAHPDRMSPVFRQQAKNIIRKLLEHTAGHPSVIGFQIDDGLKQYETSFSEVQRLFVEKLKETFRTTERLNQAFGLAHGSHSLSEWEDFPDMAGCTHGGLASEFQRFRRSLAAGYLSWQSGLVKEYKRREQFITHNFDFCRNKGRTEISRGGGCYGLPPDINHWEAAKALTVAGADIYHPTQQELTGAEIAFGGDSIRSLKQDNYLVLECQSQAIKNWTPFPGQLKLHAYSHLANGADGLIYRGWHSHHNGFETYFKGILSHDLESNPIYEEIARIGKEWDKLGSSVRHLKKKNKIALVVDSRSLTALQWFPIDEELSYNDVVRWMYDSLYEMNLECDVVDVQGLDAKKYSMIVVPALYCASEQTIYDLKEFVAEGGVLVSSFKSFVADEKLTVYHDRLPHVLTECFGGSYTQFTEPGTATLKNQPVRYMAELLVPDKDCGGVFYEHKYWGRYAGILTHAYKKGSAFYIGCYTTKAVLKEIYQEAAKRAGLFLPKFTFPIIIRNGINERGENLHYILHYSDEKEEIPCPYREARDIISGEVYQYNDSISLLDWDVRILVEK